jgi:hypothetical protein
VTREEFETQVAAEEAFKTYVQRVAKMVLRPEEDPGSMYPNFFKFNRVVRDPKLGLQIEFFNGGTPVTVSGEYFYGDALANVEAKHREAREKFLEHSRATALDDFAFKLVKLGYTGDKSLLVERLGKFVEQLGSEDK